MNGSEWLNILPNEMPKKPGTGRDRAVLDAVESGLLTSSWSSIISKIPGYEAVFSVTSDALHVVLNNGQRFRPQCSAWLQQKCADLLGASLPTAKIMDLSYIQAIVKLEAVTLPAGAKMTLTDYSKMYNLSLEKQRNGRDGLIRDSGKTWCLSNRISESAIKAINYGFYSKSGYVNNVGLKLFQTLGGRHDFLHQDYSQCILLMSSMCMLNGEMVPIQKIMSDPKLCQLISYEGVLKFQRQPNVSFTIDSKLIA